MQQQTHPVDRVALIADLGSTMADRVVSELEAHHFAVETVGHGEGVVDPPSVTVVLVECPAAVETLRARLDRSRLPTLVLTATPDLLAGVLPLLDTGHDVGLVPEGTCVLGWRLRRLIEQSRRTEHLENRTDPLTGLLNRRAFEAQLHHVTESMAPDETVGLLMLDLDHFKLINDRLGHLAGDQVIRAVGNLMRGSFSPGDPIGRLGGDEFGCILARHDTVSVREACDQLLRRLSALDVPELGVEATSVRIFASAGLTYVRPAAPIDDLLGEAEQTMYEAKQRGRNQLVDYGELVEAAKDSSRDLRLQHFENATRVATERLFEMITLKSRRLVESARQEANVCPLTGLYSRRYFDARLSREIDRARSENRPLSMAFIDLDHFHEVNATHGWPTGDRVLQGFALVARANVRSTDWVARYGGEEFVIVMPDTSLDSAREVTERLRQAFASATIDSLDGSRVAATLSAGVAQLQDRAGPAVAFVNQASIELLRAKGSGRNRVVQSGAAVVNRGGRASGWPSIESIAGDPPGSPAGATPVSVLYPSSSPDHL
jgi:two-component system, cell cycle response regulator